MPSLWSRIKENLLYLFLLVCNLAIKGASAAYVLETSAFSWPAVRGQPQLRQPPYPGGLFVTEEMTLIVASVALGWELVKTVVLFYTMVFREMDPRQLPKPALFAIGVVELAVTACFVALLRMQAAYTPGSCKHADEWRFDADGVPSLFAVLAQHWPVHAKKMTAQSVCTLFIVRRTSEIVYTVFHTLFALPFILGLLFFAFLMSIVLTAAAYRTASAFVLFFVKWGRSFRRRRRNPRDVGEQAEADAIKLRDVEPPVDDLAVANSSDLPLAGHLPGGTNAEEGAIRHYAEAKRRITREGGWSRQRRRSRPDEEEGDAQDDGALRRTTCTAGAKSECWGCGGQICRDCQVARPLADPDTTRHIDECGTICTGCLLHRIYVREHPQITTNVQQQRRCSHRDPVAGSAATERDICSTCAAEPAARVRERRAAREAAELRDLEEGRVVCSLCHREMRWGPRWWVCLMCGKACNSSVHAPWVVRG